MVRALNRVTSLVRANTEFLFRAGCAFFFVALWVIGDVLLTPELKTPWPAISWLQLAIAAGEALPFEQNDVKFTLHAIECRVYAEDPLKHYLPSPGRITVFQTPEGDGIRNDIGTYAGDEVSTYYDPLLSKLLTWGSDRQEALRRMDRALAAYRVEGVHTNLPLLRAIITHPEFRAGDATTEGARRRGSIGARSLPLRGPIARPSGPASMQ